MERQMKTLVLITLLLCSSSFAGTWKKITSGAPTYQVCPDGFIFVPALSGYTTRDFCVAKYEMKYTDEMTSQASGTPRLVTNRDSANRYCSSLGEGFGQISNDQWQTIARNIAGVASNWSGGAVGSGELNRGHSDGSPNNTLAATVDTDPCYGTGQTCSPSTWNSQRRTHTLSNGNVIWDFAGNLSEWVTNDNNASYGSSVYISTMSTGDIRQIRYGAAAGTFCATASATPFCGMGVGNLSGSAGAVVRGGRWNGDVESGVFATGLYSALLTSATDIGFRCVFAP